jgi:hypothetical protein
MGRYLFGGGIADWALTPTTLTLVGSVTGSAVVGVAQAGAVDITCWTAETGGTQYTDLQTTAGAPIDHVTTSDGSDGRAAGQIPPFYGPDGINVVWAAAAAGPRVRLAAFLPVGQVASSVAAGDDSRFASASLRYGGGREGIASVTATGATTTVNIANANTTTLTLNASTALTLSGATASTSCTVSLYVVQGTGGGRTITWPASVKWPGGTAPTLSTAVGARDLIVLETVDGGTTWFASLAGLDFK